MPTLLEEKVSIWVKAEAGFQTVLMLLDPPPLVNEKLIGVESALSSLGICDPSSDRERRLSLPSNRKTTTDSSSDAEEDPLGLTSRDCSAQGQSQVEECMSREDACEKASFSNLISQTVRSMAGGGQRKQPCDQVEPGMLTIETINNRDRATALPLSKADITTKARSTRPSHYMNNLLASFTTARPDSGTSPAVEDKQSEHNRSTSLFSDLVPRGPVMNDYEALFTPGKSEYLECQESLTMSTADILSQWIKSLGGPESGSSSPDPLHLIFNIIKRDSWEALHLYEKALTTIGRNMLDDSTLQENLRHWRVTIEKIECELSRLRDSLTRFAGSFIVETPIPPSSTIPVWQECSLPDFLARITKLEKQTSKTHKHLMATISIIESKRGIAESENITKLTELSFLFIPLTFSASVFSMQVRELRDAHVSIFTFALLAFILVVALYAVRLLTRSQSFLGWRKKCTSQVRATSKLQPGAFISTRSYLIWAWRTVGLILVPASFIALVTVPGLVVLWEKVGNTQLNLFITLLVTFDALMAAWYLAKAVFYSDCKGLHFRYSIFPLKKIEGTSGVSSRQASRTLWQKFHRARARKSLQFFLFINVACLPLSFMWAQPTSIILKIAITLVMIMLVSFHVFVYTSSHKTLEAEKWKLPR